jgi:hypothetical protein
VSEVKSKERRGEAIESSTGWRIHQYKTEMTT